jgi:PAS domain S-box-containing protein
LAEDPVNPLTPEILTMQTLLVGGLVSIVNAATAFYLWNERRSERFLLFWSVSWAFNAIRWATVYFSLGDPRLAPFLSFQSAAVHFLIVLGCYDLLPGKAWKRPSMVALAGVFALSFTFAGLAAEKPAAMEYARSFALLLFWAASMLWAYRTERLPGYAFAAGTIAVWWAYVGVALFVMGPAIATHVVIPLFNMPLMFSIIVIAYQRSRRELVENQRTLQTLFDSVPTPVVITRPPHGEIERANAAAGQVLGLRPEEAPGRNAVEHGLVIEPHAREAVYAELAQGRSVKGRIIVFQSKGGEPRTIAVNADRIVLASGERYIFTFHDLTDLRRAENAAFESDRARRAAEVALQKERDELAHAQRVTTLGELAASLAHEIGQPLTAILSNAQAARRFQKMDPAHPEVDGALQDIASAARDAGDTIARLRALFRKGETQRSLLDVNTLVEDVSRLMHGTLVRKDVDFFFEPGADVPQIHADSVQLRQVLLNVLVNAEEAIAAASGGAREIHIRTSRTPAGCALVTVRDTGVGVPDADVDRIFSHFVTSKPQGLGMGLAISRTILDAHDGRIWASRGEGPGLTLHIELPAANPG